jgi:hypothetical protein
MSGGPNAVPLSEQRFALLMDNGYHEDVYREYPPQEDIDEAREAAPDAWTAVEELKGGLDRRSLHYWPPLNSDPLAQGGHQ